MVSRRLSNTERFVPPWPSADRLMSLTFVFVAIGVLAAFIYLAQQQELALMLLLVAGMVLAFFVVIRPEIGMVALILCAGVVRVSVSTGTGTPLVASLAVAGLLLAGWITHRMLHKQRVVMLPRAIVIPAAILTGATLFSLIWGRLSLDPRVTYFPGFIQVQLAAASLTVISVGLLFVGADLFRDRQLRRVIILVTIAVGIVALPYRVRVDTAPFVNAAGVFGVWFVAYCWSNALVNRRLPDPIRAGLGCLAVGWLAMAMTREQSWVSGWLPTLVGMIIVTVIARPRIGSVVILFGTVAIAFYNSLFYAILVTKQEHEGSLGGEFGRLELWKRNLEVVSDHLIFGTGPAGYALYYMTFLPDRAMSTHSNYVDILAQNGIFGLVGLVGLFAGLFTVGRRILPLARDPEDRATVIAVLGGLPAVAASLWLGDWLIPFVYNQTLAGFDHAVYSWLGFAMLCGLAAQLRPEGSAGG